MPTSPWASLYRWGARFQHYRVLPGQLAGLQAISEARPQAHFQPGCGAIDTAFLLQGQVPPWGRGHRRGWRAMTNDVPLIIKMRQIQTEPHSSRPTWPFIFFCGVSSVSESKRIQVVFDQHFYLCVSGVTVLLSAAGVILFFEFKSEQRKAMNSRALWRRKIKNHLTVAQAILTRMLGYFKPRYSHGYIVLYK